jgi:hypothetical protein
MQGSKGRQMYRGCAFINAVAELGDSVPDVARICKRHKLEMQQTIAALLPDSAVRETAANAATIAIDGAIIKAQLEAPAPGEMHALEGLKTLLRALDQASR